MVRVVSAAVLLAILYVTVWVLPPRAMAVAGALVAAFAATELAGLARKTGLHANTAFLAIAAAGVAFAFAHDAQLGASHATLTLLLTFMIASGALAIAHGGPSVAALSSVGIACLVPLYVGLPVGAIVALHSWFGAKTTTWLLLTIAASDSAQYYTGRAFGRRKLAPAISPGKTVEGAAGGLLVATAAGTVLGAWALPGTELHSLAIVSLGLAGAGILGDLFESLLKRSVGAKDSSTLIPGHGGVLDRIDSYLFAAPLLYAVAFRMVP